MKKIFFSALAVVLCLSIRVFAFELLQYRWGESKKDMEAQLLQKGKTLEKASAPEVIVFHDDYMGSDRKVTLVFTPQSLALAIVYIEWSDIAVARDAVEALKKRYGDPYKLDSHNVHYEWNGGFSGEKIILDGNKLSIYGGEYYQRYSKEKAGG